MKITIMFLNLFLILAFNSYSQSLEKVLENYSESVGQEILSEKETYRITMMIEQGGMEIPLTVIGKRPNMIRSEVTFQGIKQITTFDGKEGWTINPFMGMTEPQRVDEPQAAQLKDQADIDGDLVNYKSKNYNLELLGEDDVDGVKVIKIKVIKPNGDVNTHYLDSENFLVIKTNTTTAENPGKSVQTYLSEYEPIEGVLFPHRVEVKAGGELLMKTKLISVEFDVEAPDSLFGKPETKQ